MLAPAAPAPVPIGDVEGSWLAYLTLHPPVRATGITVCVRIGCTQPAAAGRTWCVEHDPLTPAEQDAFRARHARRDRALALHGPGRRIACATPECPAVALPDLDHCDDHRARCTGLTQAGTRCTSKVPYLADKCGTHLRGQGRVGIPEVGDPVPCLDCGRPTRYADATCLRCATLVDEPLMLL